ncbi:MAG: hypothetical protein ACYC7A_13705 [Thermoanaerobaculia bacterium]
MDRKRLFVARWVPPIALWLAEKALERPKVAKVARRVDNRISDKQSEAMDSLRRAKSNAKSNPAWLGAGAAAIAIGLGLIARSTRK